MVVRVMAMLWLFNARRAIGFRVVCLGDSITEGGHGAANSEEAGYPYFLGQLLPDAEVVNLGSGAKRGATVWRAKRV